MQKLTVSQMQQSFRYRSLFKTGQANPLILITIALLPALLALLYIGYTSYTQWRTETEQAKAAIMQQKEKQQARSQMPLVTVKSYPSTQALVPLSEYTVAISPGNNKTQNLTSENRFVAQTEAEAITSEQAYSAPNSEAGSEAEQDLNLDSLDLSELSPELAERVKNVLDDSSGNSEEARFSSESPENNNQSSEAYHLVEHQSRFSGKLPAMNLQAHIYASNAEHRRVKINGQELSEGDWLGEQIQLLEIAPRSITVKFNGTEIIIPDLYEWQG